MPNRAASGFLFLLAGCSSLGGPLDIITPDEFTLGQGSSEYDWDGGHMNSEPAYAYDGESESTYAAFTWHLPSFKGESDGISRETQRNLSLLIDQMVEDEIKAEGSAWGVTTVDGEDPQVPSWLPLVLGGVVLVVLIAGVLFTRKQSSW